MPEATQDKCNSDDEPFSVGCKMGALPCHQGKWDDSKTGSPDGPLPLQAKCWPVAPNKADYIAQGPDMEQHINASTAEWNIYDLNNWETVCPNANDKVKGPTSGFSCAYPPLGCSMSAWEAVDGKDILKPKAVYSNDVGAGQPPTDWKYVTPGDTDAIKAAVAAGFNIPWGCQGDPVNIAKRTDTKTGFVRENLPDDSSSNVVQNTGCTNDIMKPMQNACEVIAQAKAAHAPDETPCEKMQKQAAELQIKLKQLANENEIVNGFREANPFNWLKNVIKAFGTDAKMKQLLQNSLSISLDSNQSQQSQQMCLNNATTIQRNDTTLGSCPNPYPQMIRELCPENPCPWNQMPETIIVPFKDQVDLGPTITKCVPRDPVVVPGSTEAKWLAERHDILSDQRKECMASPFVTARSRELLAASKKFTYDRSKVVNNVDITQTAENSITQTCEQNVEQQQLSNQSAGIMNSITQQLAQASKGFNAHVEGDQTTSNCVDANVNSCQSAISQACCSNSASTLQTNSVTAVLGCSPGIQKVNHSLKNTTEQLCTQGATQGQKNKQKADITNKIAQKATQTAIGMNPMIIFIIFAIVIGLLVLSPVGLVFVLGSKILFIIIIIGIVLMVIGGCQFPIYFASQFKGGCYENSPLLLTTKQQANPKGFIFTNWKAAKETYDKDGEIAAFDFLPTCITLKGQDACSTEVSDGYRTFPKPMATGTAGIFVYPDNTPGWAVYYSSVAKDVKTGVKLPSRGNNFPLADKATDPTKAWTAYNAKITGWSAATPPTETAQGKPGCAEIDKKCVTEPGPGVTAQGPSDPIFPSLTYIRDYKPTFWLYSAIITTMVGCLFVGIGIWMNAARSKKPARFNTQAKKNNSKRSAKSSMPRRAGVK